MRASINARLASIAAFAAIGLGGCTSGNSAIQPPYQSTNISTVGKLQFEVGTATIAMQSSSVEPYIGLNTVVTFRQSGGDSATAVNTPVITGPPGFKVPNSPGAGDDAGTNHISGSPQSTSSASTTFGEVGQATLYGFGPNNYYTSGSTYFGNFAVPFYNDQLAGSTSSGGYPQTAFYGVPPAFPASPVSGFPGFNLGFVDFIAPAVSGTYQLAVTVPTAPGSSQAPYTYHANASMKISRVLPVFDGGAFTSNASGGGHVKVVLPAGTNEAYVQIVDFYSGAQFGLAFHGSSTQTLPDGSLAPCDVYELIGAAFDYPALEAAAPKNTQQTPKIRGSHGQDDVTVSYPQFGQVPPPPSSSGCSSSSSGHTRKPMR
jgi:hypothetical protein